MESFNSNYMLMGEYLTYKGISNKWNLTKLTKGDVTVNDVIKDILSVYVVVPDHSVSVEQLAGITQPVKKLLAKKNQIEKEYSKMVTALKRKQESGRTVGSAVLPHLKRLIPSDLVGGKGNKQKILLSFQKCFKYGKMDRIPVKYFMNGLSLKKVLWLKSLKCPTLKKYVMVKLVVWLWKVTKKLIASKFYVSEAQGTQNKLLYIPKKVWQNQVDRAFNLLLSQGTLRPLALYEDEADEVKKLEALRAPATLRWLPKKNGLRPVISVKNDKLKPATIEAKLLLKHLLAKSYTNLTTQRLHKIWTGIIERSHLQGWTQLFMVAVDLHDAYGSIIQDKLVQIVKQVVVSHMGNITQHSVVHIDEVIVNNKKILTFRELYEGEYKQVAQSKEVKVMHLINTIKRAIKCQTIRRRRRPYLLIKGISQAVPLSAHLCNLYLEDLNKTHLTQFTAHQEDTLIRAVDDYLYITPNKARAEEFLHTMSVGFEDYGLHINNVKTQSNLSGNLEISFFGFFINSSNLEVYVKYNHGVNLPFRSSVTFTSSPSLSILEDRMRRIPTYKLNFLTLDRSYMTVRGVARNVLHTSCVMAGSFRATVDTWRLNVGNEQLMTIISKSAKKMARRIHKITGVNALTEREIHWIVIRAFWLVLSQNAVRQNTGFPECILLCLEQYEEMARNGVRNLTFKSLSSIVGTLPSQFRTGY